MMTFFSLFLHNYQAKFLSVITFGGLCYINIYVGTKFFDEHNSEINKFILRCSKLCGVNCGRGKLFFANHGEEKKPLKA